VEGSQTIAALGADAPDARRYEPRSIVRNYGIAAIGEAVSKGAAFVATVVVARALSPDDFGRFSFVVALVAIAMLFSDVGLQVATTRAVARERTRAFEYASAALVVGVAIAAVVYAGIAIVAAAGTFPHGVGSAVVVYAGVLFLAAGVNAYWSLLRGNDRQDLVYVTYAVSSVALLVAVVAASVGGASLVGILLLYVGTIALRLLLTVGVVWWKLERPRLLVARASTRTLFAAAPGAAIAYVLQEVYSHGDVILLGFLVSAADVGYYAAAYRLVDAVTFLTAGALTAAVFPVFSRLSREAPEQVPGLYNRLVRLLIAALAPAALVFVAISRPLVDAIYSFPNDDAAIIFALLAPAAPLIAVNFTTVFLALAIGRTGTAIAAGSVAAVVNVTTNLTVVPVVGVEAAAVATVFAEIVMVATFVVILERSGFGTETRRAVAIAAVALVPPLALMAAFPSRYVEIALVGIPFAVGVVAATGLVRLDDLRPLRLLFAGIRQAREGGGDTVDE
jgi:O-antigen/teichoic acid export membrane protein